MKKFYILITAILFIQLSFAQPANDDCSAPETITVSASTASFTFDINTAALNSETICTTTTDFADVWYQFTMPFNGNVFVDGSISWNNFALYNTCGSTAISCENAGALFTNLISGNTYLLRVYRTSSTNTNTAYQNFSIKAFPDATNDDCASAENITVSTTASTVNFEIGGAEINNEIGCSGSALEYVDIWYDFTMPVNGNLYVDGGIGWNNFALYDTCSGSQIQCGSGNQLFTGLISGTNYKLRLFRTKANADNSYLSFTIKAFQEVANDTCASAENLIVSTTTSTVNFEIGGATVNNEEGCVATTTSDYVDIWYDFTMPVNGNLYVDGAIGWNNFALYDVCSGTQLQCGSGNQLFTELISGVNYKLRLFRTRSNADNTYLSFTAKVFQAVTNDTCASAENIPVTTSLSTVNFDIGGAIVNSESGCSGGNIAEYVDIWYNFTMPVNGNIYVDGSIGWNNFALYDTCAGTEIQCSSGNVLFLGLISGNTYKLRLFRTRSNADNTYLSFNIQAFEIINNDDCASAEVTNVQSNSPTTINFGIAGATVNNEEGCLGTAAEDYVDVWYEFTMPEDGDIVIDGDISWNNFAIYDACSGTELGCFSTSGNISGLTNGAMYKLRVFRTLANADNTAYKSFTIESSSTLSVDDVSLENEMKIYPNPVVDIIQISNARMIESISIYDLNGRQVLKLPFTETLNLKSLESGIFFLKIISENSIITKKIIKK